MAKISPLMIMPPVIFAAFAGLALAGMLRENPDELRSTFIGNQAPSVPVEAVQGTVQLTDADLRSGDLTIVNFWASWCPPCRAEHPNLLDQQDQASTYLTDYDDPFFATGFDLRGRNAIDWGVTAPPETFIVDGDGTVLFRFVGPLVGSDYEERFLPELAKAAE
jgi:cytochrome c biogenesis protein CcmG/thiol:disulfide interchange protein DsbE